MSNKFYNTRGLSNLRSVLSVAAVVAGISVAGHAIAATGAADLAGAKQQYEKERARCLSGQTNQDQATCLKSAGAAYDEAKRGRLDDAKHPYEQNKTSRCDPLPAGDREDCLRRMKGEGTVSGSPEKGGELRELTTVQPKP